MAALSNNIAWQPGGDAAARSWRRRVIVAWHQASSNIMPQQRILACNGITVLTRADKQISAKWQAAAYSAGSIGMWRRHQRENINAARQNAPCATHRNNGHSGVARHGGREGKGAPAASTGIVLAWRQRIIMVAHLSSDSSQTKLAAHRVEDA